MNPAAPDDSRAAAERAAAPTAAPDAVPPQAGAPRSGIARLTSEQLFAGAAEVQIDHHGAVYRLKQTSLGKLILTK